MPHSKIDFTPGFRRCSGFIFAQCGDLKVLRYGKVKSKTHHGGTEIRRRSKPILTTEDTEGHGGELETKSLPQRAQRRIKAIKFGQNEGISD